MKSKKPRLIATQRKKANKRFRKLNRSGIIMLDILIILAIFFNIGAMVITNALVVKVEPEVEFLEVNVFQAEMNDYEPHPEAKKIMLTFMKQCLFYILILGYYFHRRRTIVDDVDYTELWFMTTMFVVMLGIDFMNDFGFLLGKIIWGG